MSANLDFSHLTVMLVDDSPLMKSLLKTMLEVLGVNKFVMANDGSDALVKFHGANGGIDLIFVDWHMSPMDGLAFTRVMRDQDSSPDPFVPIIMVTAYTEKIKVEAARDSGITEFLAKPITPKALYSRLQWVIERPRDFVQKGDYFGPDRRRREEELEGSERRSNAAPPR